MKIQVLYFEGCPGYEALLPSLRKLLVAEGIEAEIERRCIESVEDAERERFLGSPSVRIDGEDVDPGAADRDDFGLKCRLYRDRDTISGTPPEGWIKTAVRAHAAE